MSLELILKVKCFNGYQKVYQHYSAEVQCNMKFSLYEPLELQGPADVLFYLSGLGNTEQNFIVEVSAQQYASKHKFIVVGPDTSPRDLNLPVETNSTYLGEGAGAYIDATKGQWAKNYRMYSYVTKELPKLIKTNFSISGRIGILGHSMGGHGALVCGLRNPEVFQSVSALAPLTNPSQIIPEGILKEWAEYLGDKKEDWASYDACEIVKVYDGPYREVLVDVGLEDEYLNALRPENLQAAANENSSGKLKLELRFQEGYDHSRMYFGKTFIGDHFKHHARILRNMALST